MATAEEIRDAQRETWARLSGGWEKWDRVILEQLRPVGDEMIGRLGLADDQQHLDIASGTGEPGLSIAARCPNGRVTLTDLSEPMLEVAARRAGAQGITNVATEVCSADDLPFADATFDSVSVRFGLMFFPDIARAIGELVRVLRPGGRLCSAVWTDPDRNPWTSILMQAIATELPLPPTDPDGPSMYRCAAPRAVSGIYEAAGLGDVDEWDVPVDLVTASAEEHWLVMSEHVSLALTALQQVDDATRDRIRARVLADVADYVDGDGTTRVPGLARCIVGTKPA
jgi:ubiquinone/menaquinone biosynthesis C-methylase UbiE